MIPVMVRDLDAAAPRVSERRRRFGLDAPLPADPAIVERAVLRHIAEDRPAIVVVGLGPPVSAPRPGPKDIDARLATGAPDLMLLLPGGRLAFLTVKTQAQDLTRAQKAFGDLCRERGCPHLIIRSLAEARAALDGLVLTPTPEIRHGGQKDHLARRRQASPSRP